MTQGFIQAGFPVVAGIDLDESCRYAYETNNGARFLREDVEQLRGEDLLALYPAGTNPILVGCAPCQPFSKYTIRTTPDEKWKLLREFARIVIEAEPTIVSMENVPLLQRHEVFTEFTTALKEAGYRVSSQIADGPRYGIPQRRRRLVLLASLLGPIELLPETHEPGERPTVRQTIGELPAIPAGGVDPHDPLHRARGLTPLNLRRLRAAKEGGTWVDWEEDLRLACHRKSTGQSFKSVYGRMRWDEPSPVITTQCIGIGNGRFGHPEQDRAISLREAALLQTFPHEYAFIDPDARRVSMQAIARQIGNAVPPRLGEIVAASVAHHLHVHGFDV